MDQAERAIHPSHTPEPDDADKLYKGGVACMRCCRFVAFDNPYRITESGVQECRPVRVELR